MRVGAPVGGRVHWFIWNLSRIIKEDYHIKFDYLYHNYKLERRNGRKIIDEFIIIRTSRRCWRCMYLHNDFKVFKYFTTHSSQEMCDNIFNTYIYFRRVENAKT